MFEDEAITEDDQSISKMEDEALGEIGDRDTYNDIRNEFEKPIDERKNELIGRDGKVVKGRRLHNTSKELVELEQMSIALGGSIINPFAKRKRSYWGAVESLIILGHDQWWSFKKVRDKIEEILSAISYNEHFSIWQDICGECDEDKKGEKKAKRKQSERPLDINGRIRTNFKTLQRVPTRKDRHPYGEKLRQQKMCIDIRFIPFEGSKDSTLGTYEYRLNTQFNSIEDVKCIYSNPLVRRGRRPKKKVLNGELPKG